MENSCHLFTEYPEQYFPIWPEKLQSEKTHYKTSFESGVLKGLNEAWFDGTIDSDCLRLAANIPSTHDLFSSALKIKLFKFEVFLEGKVIRTFTYSEADTKTTEFLSNNQYSYTHTYAKSLFRYKHEKFDGLKVIWKLDFMMDLKKTLENIQLQHPTMNGMFAQYHKSNFLSDFILCCEEEEFQVHRFVLAMSGPVFLKMFESNMKENLEGRAVIKRVDKETLKTLLEWVYTGKVEKDQDLEDLLDLYKAADMYCIQVLKNWCTMKILPEVGIENAEEIRKLGEFYGEQIWIKRAKSVQHQ